MASFGALVPGCFVRRENRFRAAVWVNGRETRVHVPNSGRLAELLAPGAPVLLQSVPRSGRATAYDLQIVNSNGSLVCVDARWPPKLVIEAWRAGRLSEFAAFAAVRSERAAGESRLDLLFTGEGGRPYWVETKCVTLVEEGIARFPDAPTTRGRRHVQELARLVQGGAGAAVMFIVQRSDAAAFAPNDEMDAAFGAALREAVTVGVRVWAYSCRVSLAGIALGHPIPLIL